MPLRLPSLYRQVMSWLRQPAMAAFARLLSIGSFSLAAVLTLFFMSALEGQWTWIVHLQRGLYRHVPQLPAEMLPIPVAFLLWVRLMERTGGKLTLAFSPFFAALSAAPLVAAPELWRDPGLQQYLFALGIVAGLFILAPFRECLKRALREPRPAIIAVIAATAACNYYYLMRFWPYFDRWTGQAAFVFLHSLGLDITAGMYQRDPTILSKHFSVIIFRTCNGLEGIFLFMFMLSVMLLLDWDLFKRRIISLLYEFGIVYMFLFNILRIASLYMVGYWAYNPDAWGWVHSLQGVSLYMFHSYLGWIYYLVAFGIFCRMGVLYRHPEEAGKAGRQ